MGRYIKRKECWILFAALCLYMGNKYYRNRFQVSEFMQCYFNDLMGGIVFGIIICTASRFWLKREVTIWLYMLLLLLAGSYWEFVAPLYIKSAVCDVGDIVAYFSGGIGLLLATRREEEKDEV